jgi:hypothetical protein
MNLFCHPNRSSHVLSQGAKVKGSHGGGGGFSPQLTDSRIAYRGVDPPHYPSASQTLGTLVLAFWCSKVNRGRMRWKRKIRGGLASTKAGLGSPGTPRAFYPSQDDHDGQSRQGDRRPRRHSGLLFARVWPADFAPALFSASLGMRSVGPSYVRIESFHQGLRLRRLSSVTTPFSCTALAIPARLA